MEVPKGLPVMATNCGKCGEVVILPDAMTEMYRRLQNEVARLTAELAKLTQAGEAAITELQLRATQRDAARAEVERLNEGIRDWLHAYDDGEVPRAAWERLHDLRYRPAPPAGKERA
ncbi:MAG: hypothetical protein KGJ23_08710 [Euryarchaeota archaeon]|nr:hypothetical protein [Euryarchaeota archaeon]